MTAKNTPSGSAFSANGRPGAKSKRCRLTLSPFRADGRSVRTSPNFTSAAMMVHVSRKFGLDELHRMNGTAASDDKIANKGTSVRSIYLYVYLKSSKN